MSVLRCLLHGTLMAFSRISIAAIRRVYGLDSHALATAVTAAPVARLFFVFDESVCQMNPVSGGPDLKFVKLWKPKSDATTCGQVKKMYKAQGCCGTPSKSFSMDGRHLAGVKGEDAQVLSVVETALRKLRAERGTESARKLAEKMNKVLEDFAGN